MIRRCASGFDRLPVTLGALLLLAFGLPGAGLPGAGLPEAAQAPASQASDISRLTLGGLVRDAAGEAVAGARVELRPTLGNFHRLRLLAAGPPGPGPVLHQRTDAAGRYSLRVPAPGFWEVRIAVDGYVPVESYSTPVVAPLTLAPVTLVPDLGVEIQVRTDDGESAAGVAIHGRASDPLAWKARAGEGWTSAPRVARSDAAGRLRLPRAMSEVLEITAVTVTGWRVATSRAQASAQLVLPPNGVGRRVRVVDESGATVAGVGIAAGNPAWSVGTSDKSGHALLTVSPTAALELQLFLADGTRWQAYLPPRDGDDPTVVEPDRVVFPRRPGLAGRVVTKADGRPLRLALVWPRHDPGTFVLTDSQGGYELPLPAYERFSVMALASGFVRRSVRAQGGAEGGRRIPTLALESAFEVAGHIVDAAGEALAAVSLEVFRDEGGAPVAWATSDAHGDFRLAGLAARSLHRAVARKDGFSTLVVPLAKPADEAPLRLVLQRSRGAFGRVVDGDEQPISGAEVSASVFGAPRGGTREPVTARTDELGRFELASLPGPRIDLEASFPGYPTLRIRGIEVPPEPESVPPEPEAEATEGTLPAPEPDPADLGTLVLVAGTELAGRVTDPEGKAVAEVEIRVVKTQEARAAAPGTALRRATVAAVSDTRGKFRITGLEPDNKLLLEARHPHHLPTLMRDVAPPLEEALHIVLDPAASVRGDVISVAGEPIVGARVALSAASPEVGEVVPRGRQGEASRSVVTDEQGGFSIAGVVPGELLISADADGYQPSTPEALAVRPRETVDGLQLILKRGAVVEGLIVDEEDEAVVGADVRLAAQRGVSDAEGRFRLVGVVPGLAPLRVEHPEFERWRREVYVELGENLMDVVLERGLEVAGRVVDERGEPVSGAQVAFERRNWRDPRRHETVSDDAGVFRVSGIIDGAYDLEAGAAGYAKTHLEAALRIDGESFTDLEVVLRPGGSVVGRILGLDFDELLGVAVTAESDALTQRGTVDYEGAYQVVDLAPGTWRVKASLEGGRREVARHVVIRGADQPARRDLEFGGVVLSGRVTYDGRPLPDTTVQLSGREIAARRTAITDYQGEFELLDLEPARYQLAVSNAQQLLNHTREVAVFSSREIGIDLESSAIAGRVIGKESARPIDGALVILTQLLGGGEIGSMVSLVADGEGAFSVARLTPGSYRLEARKDAYAPAEQLLEIEAGTDREDLEVPMEATAGVELQVRLASGRLPESLLLNVLGSGGQSIFSEFRVGLQGGYAYFPTVPSGSWELVVSTSGGAASRVPATVPGPPIEVVLPDAGRLRVQVGALAESNLLATLTLFGPGGGPFEAVDGSGRLQREWTVTGGAAVVADIPAGVWVLRVVAADGQLWEGTVTTSGSPWAEIEL